MKRKPTPYELALWAALPMAHTTNIEGRLTMILDTTRSRRALTRRALLLVLTPGAAALVTLAMVRLDAKAQASPLPVAAAPAVTPRAADAPLVPVTVPPAASHPAPLASVSAVALPALQPVQPVAAKMQAGPPPMAPLAATRPKGIGPAPARFVEPKGHYSVPVRIVTPIGPVRLDSGLPPTPPVYSRRISEDGFSVDLSGVTDADKPGGPWWSNAGTPLPKPVYDTAAHRAESHAFGGDTKNVIFAFRLPAASVGATVAYKVSGAVGFSSEGSWMSKMQGEEHQTEAQAHAGSGGARVVTAAFPASLTKTDIQVGIASGPWKVAATYVTGALGRGGNIGTRQGNSTFLFSPVAETKDGTIISIATDATDDLRVVAVDAQGKETLPDQPGDNSMGTLDQITVRFALPLAQIKEVRVETRPFQWIEIRDVALQPAKSLPL